MSSDILSSVNSRAATGLEGVLTGDKATAVLSSELLRNWGKRRVKSRISDLVGARRSIVIAET